MDIPSMTQTIADRIQLRLDALGKNPSGVALEAGLGRSSVRDILLGRASNPRMDTLLKLAGPLQCTVDYLIGETRHDTLLPDFIGEFDPKPGEILSILRAGVFRPSSAKEEEAVASLDRFITYKDLRYPDHWISDFAMGDNSMDAIGIYKGDIISAISLKDEEEYTLKHGDLIIVNHSLGKPDIYENSLRFVEIDGDKILLTCKSLTQSIEPIVLGKRLSSTFKYAWSVKDATSIILTGDLAVRVRRQLR